jgi:dipeptidyl aminopeptidase/acylaminoacyl peptidase
MTLNALTPARVPLAPEDIWRIHSISDPTIHPDGSRVAYVVYTPQPEHDTYRSEIRVVNWDGQCERTVTAAGMNAGAPAWSPDGRTLLFLSRRPEHDRSQIYLLPTDMGEARRITSVSGSIVAAIWSPNGRWVAFLSLVDPQQAARTTALANDVEVLDQLVWAEDGIGSLTRRRAHLFVASFDGATIRQLTAGDYSVQHFVFAADSNQLFYTATPDPADDWVTALQSEIFTVGVAGGPPRQITQFGGKIAAVRTLPDGALLVIGSDLEHDEASPAQLWRVELPNGELQRLTPAFDRSIGDSIFCDVRFPSRSHDPWVATDGLTARMRVTDGGAVRLAEVDLVSGTVRWLTPADLSVLAWHSASDGCRRVELRTTMIDLPELWAVEDSGVARRLTHLNDALLTERATFVPQAIGFVASDGVPIEAWIMLPQQQNTAAFPTLIAIHGGPKRGTYGHAFMFEFHMLAAAGLAVAYCNYRGSDGYGAAFARAIYGRCDNLDARDNLELIEHLFELDLGLDPQRISLNGGGYGGFVSNWLISQSSRFKAAISQRSISNWASLYGASPIGFHMAATHLGCLPWENPEQYHRCSPLSYAHQIRTPLLLIHGEEDLRCTIEQADQLFTALRRLGRTVRLARFPREGHAMTRTGTPRHRAENLRLILEWLRTHA